MLSLRSLLALLACCCASSALAGPRQTITYANVDSVGPSGTPGNQTRTISLNGSFPLKSIDFSGQLTNLIAGSQPIHAHVVITPPPNTGFTWELPIIWNSSTPAVNAVNTGSYSFAVPANWPSTGVFTIEFIDDTDNGPGADARWKTFNITLCDSAVPPAWPYFSDNWDDMGLITDGTRSHSVQISPNAVQWVRFHTAGPVGAQEFGRSLTIETTGTALAPTNDTVIALYDASGHRIALNDDINGTANRMSGLSFGTSLPAGSPILESRVGADGSLPAGTYYLAIVGYSSGNNYIDDFGVTSVSNASGGAVITIRSSIPPVASTCPADFNHSNSLDVQDIFDFLSAWFAGCP